MKTNTQRVNDLMMIALNVINDFDFEKSVEDNIIRVAHFDFNIVDLSDIEVNYVKRTIDGLIVI